jgi:two-component system, chemotaxis family, chemotaxis protein CheY
MRALVVDDSSTTRFLLGMILKELDIECLTAVDGVQALRLLGQIGKVDFLFVDCNMPKLDGLALVNTVRAQAEYDPVRILMVTVNSDLESVTAALAAGVSDYVMKPFDKQMIASKLELLACR